MPTLRKKSIIPSLEELMLAYESCHTSGDYIGFCTKCGLQHFDVEPDAHGYKCEFCGAMEVYGAEELLIIEERFTLEQIKQWLIAKGKLP